MLFTFMFEKKPDMTFLELYYNIHKGGGSVWWREGSGMADIGGWLVQSNRWFVTNSHGYPMVIQGQRCFNSYRLPQVTLPVL